MDGWAAIVEPPTIKALVIFHLSFECFPLHIVEECFLKQRDNWITARGGFDWDLWGEEK